MDSSDLPALYASADSGSNKAQKKYLRTIRSEYLFLVAAAALSPWANSYDYAFWGLLGVLIMLFGLLVFRFFSRLDRQWYACRALAESIKTSAWKFAMRSHPYDDADSVRIPIREFLNALGIIRTDNEFIREGLDAEYSDKAQVTEKMLELRSMDWQARLDLYLRDRVQNQRTWYAKKAKWNSKRRSIWFGFAVVVYLLAISVLVSSKFDVAFFSNTFDALLVLATSSIGWIQVKRHGELAASYKLTAHEIGALQGYSVDVDSDESLSNFVVQAELAFSREHTQWSARRDF